MAVIVAKARDSSRRRSRSFASSLLLILLLAPSMMLAEEDSCTYPLDNTPYITFKNRQLPNNSFVAISEVTVLSPLRCHTNTDTCCNTKDSEGRYRGNWSLPDGDIVNGASGSGYGVLRYVDSMDLVYENGMDDLGIVPPRVAGIYGCTTAVSQGGEIVLKTVYVGLYAVDTLEIQDMFLTENSDLNGDNPQFTLTCISTGGPVGCVTWRRHKTIITEPNVTSVVIDRENGVYMHNLTVSEILGGPYSCSVNNDKPASDYGGYTVEYAGDPLYCLADQVGPSAIKVHWRRDTSHDTAIGFRVYFHGPTNGSMDIDDGEQESYVLTDLKNNGTYFIYVAAKSIHLPSNRIPAYPVQMVPGPPELQLNSVTPDSLSLSWRIPDGSLVNAIEIQWNINHSRATTIRDMLQPSRNNYTITGLKEFGNATYTINLIAHNSVGSGYSSNMNILANVATAGQVDGTSEDGSRSQSDGVNEAMIIGVTLGVVVIAAIVLVILGLLCYLYKSKNSKKPVYSLPAPVLSGNSISPAHPLPNPPLPRPRPRVPPPLRPPAEIATVSNSSYTPTSTNASTGRQTTAAAVAGGDDDDDRVSSLYTAVSYTYPNPPQTLPTHQPHRQRQQRENDTTTTSPTSVVVGQNHRAAATAVHKYDYIPIVS